MTDLVELEILNSRLQAIAEEAQFTLERSAHSPSIREGADCSTGLFDSAGNMVAQATAIPVHLGSLEAAVAGLLAHFPVASMSDGDVYIMNDPYSGGQHYPDIIMLTPVMFDRAVVALHCSLGHHQDIGGIAPGGNPTNATETFQEGLCIPPVKLFDRGVLNTAIRSILRGNVRIPDVVWGDVEAQIAAAHVASRRLLHLLDVIGPSAFQHGVTELQDMSEELTRRVIAAIPDGTYRFDDYLDNDGVELDKLVRIEVAVTVSGSDVFVDFTGTDPQVRGPINAVPSVALSAVRYVLRCVTGADVPHNSGCFRMIDISIPEGTLLNPIAPAAVSCRAVTLRRVVDAMIGALAQALPDVVPAASSGHPFSQRLGGRGSTGGAWVTSVIGTGGMGARPGLDGIDAIQTDASNSQNIPIEYLETYLPFHVLEFGLRPDSCGAGEYRGGLGLVMKYRILEDGVILTHRGERFFTRPWGLCGGRPAQSSEAYVRRADGTMEKILSKGIFTLRRMDEVEVLSAGGGGRGDPFRRDPHAVERDVRQGKVTAESARSIYGVEIIPETGAVDPAATSSLRSNASAAHVPSVADVAR